MAANLHPEHIHPFRTYYHEVLLVIGVLLSIGLMTFTNKPSLYFPKIMWVPLVLCLVLSLQMATGLTLPQHIYFPLMLLVMTALSMVLGASWAALVDGAVKICLMMAVVFVLSGLLSVVMQMVQIMSLDLRPVVMYIAPNPQSLMRPFANVAQPNQLALLFCFALASLWWLVQVQRLRAGVAWFLAVVFLVGLALTQSRIGWIIMPLFVGLLCSGWLGRGKDFTASNRWAMVALLAIYIALILALPTIAHSLGFASGSVEDRIGGRSERTILLQQAWAMAKAHPWFGVGWFGFGKEQIHIAPEFSSTTYAEHAHNIVMNFAAELGFPITILILAGLMFWFWQHCIAKATARNTQVGFAMLCFLAVGVHSMVEFPLWYGYVLLPMALLMGMVQQIRDDQCGESMSLSVPRAVPFTVAFVGLLMLVFVSLDYQRVVNGFKVFRSAKSIADAPPDAIAAPKFTLLPDYYDYFQLLKFTPRAGMDGREIAFIEKTCHRFGFVHMLNKLAEVYALNNQPHNAERTLVTLQRLHPIFYSEYYDYWERLAEHDVRYAVVFKRMPARDSD